MCFSSKENILLLFNLPYCDFPLTLLETPESLHLPPEFSYGLLVVDQAAFVFTQRLDCTNATSEEATEVWSIFWHFWKSYHPS